MVWVLRSFLGLVGAGVLFVVLGLILPSSQRIEESILIARPATTIFTLASDARSNAEWAPWRMSHPDVQVSVSDPPSGVGASVSWRTPSGAAGRQTIVSAEAPILVNSAYDFGLRGQAQSSLVIDAQSDGAQVTWIYEVDHGFNLIARYAGVLSSGRVRLAARDSLASLKLTAERLPQADFSEADIQLVAREPMTIVYAERAVRGDRVAFMASLQETLSEVRAFMAAQGQIPSGPEMVMVMDFDPDLSQRTYRVAVPYVGAEGESSPRVAYGVAPGGQTLVAALGGAVSDVTMPPDVLVAYLAAHRVELAGPWRQALVGAGDASDLAVTRLEAVVADGG